MKVFNGVETDENEPEKSYSYKIARDRVDNSMTVVKLAAACGVSERTIVRYENGWIDYNSMSADILAAIGKVLRGDSMAYLSDYQQWCYVRSFVSDIQWALGIYRKYYRGIGEFAKDCKTTHRSIYLWAKGVGIPNVETYNKIKELKKKEGVE